MEPCASVWSDWEFVCQLDVDHTGPHYGSADDRVAYWGAGGPSEWTRAS